MRNCIVDLILLYWIQDVLLSYDKIWVGNTDFAYQLMKSHLPVGIKSLFTHSYYLFEL